MNVRFLGNPRSPIKFYLEEREGYHDQHRPTDWLVSHGYRQLVTPKQLATVPPGHALNCHSGYLPWGRGADPNFWGWVAPEPHGVTIHEMTEGYDEGPVLAAKKVYLGEGLHTFRTSYHALQAELYRLFVEAWELIRTGDMRSNAQPLGDFPTRKPEEKVPYLQYLTNGWDTPVAEFFNRMRA